MMLGVKRAVLAPPTQRMIDGWSAQIRRVSPYNQGFSVILSASEES